MTTGASAASCRISRPSTSRCQIDLRPYSRLPRIQANGLYPFGDSNFEAVLNAEFVDFVRSINSGGPRDIDAAGNYAPPIDPAGVRLNLAPELRYSYRGPGYFFEPAVGYDFTQYDCTIRRSGLPNNPTRALPYRAGRHRLVFEREAGSHGQRTQTLEPRHGLQLRALSQPGRAAGVRLRPARPQPDRTVPHQPLRRL